MADRPAKEEDEDEVLFVDTPNKESPQPIEIQPITESNSLPGVPENVGVEDVSKDEGAGESPAEESSQKLDPVQLASILKDFQGPTDPIFEGYPDYMAAIVKEMLESDFLLVLGKGLGLTSILNLFLAKVKQACPTALVLVLGKRIEEEEDFRQVDSDDADEKIAFGVSASKRAKLYSKGGIYQITAPIAVVDILTGVLDASTVSGLVINHGESIGENSTAAFFIKLLRERNNVAFIKALSDAPERLVLPPALPLRLRVLGVQTIMLWPRFHLAVDRSLPRLEVDEIIVEQPPPIRKQQALLTELMQAVLSDVKRRVPHLDVEYLAPALGAQQPTENPEQLHAVSSVDAILAAPDLPWRIRNALQGVWHQLSRDGKRSVYSLGTLQQLQLTLTQFDAMSFWSQLDFACRDNSEPWVNLAAADALVAEARREAALRRVPGKFHHLRELLQSFTSGELALILCESSKTVLELQEYLSRPTEQEAGDEETAKELERRMLEADQERERVRAAERAAKVNEGRPGRRRVRGGKAPSPGRSEQPPADPEVKVEETESPVAERTASPEIPILKRKYKEIDLTTDNPEESEHQLTGPTSIPARVVFSTYRSGTVFRSLKPDHIIMYDPNLRFTREVEVYAATIADPKKRPTIHFMYYQKSVEELQYLTEMRREKDAFTRLIREKGLMPMVIRDGETGGGDDDDIKILGSSKRSYQISKARQKVVVDTREFRSALPFLIWRTRMDVVPITLLVGDYILTPEIVVERKSVTDLIGSFRDGRLYAQCEAMQRHYKIAVLLVEFDNLSHFSMEPFKDIRSRQSADVQREIQDNISALLLRFPKLKLIWSASPLHSAQIFRSLKEMEPEPEPEECAKAGQSVLFDSVALSMLESMPGITPRNAHLVAKHASTLAELCELDRKVIVDALGPENGDKLYRFLTMRRPES